jgi:hypothetical protein
MHCRAGIERRALRLFPGAATMKPERPVEPPATADRPLPLARVDAGHGDQRTCSPRAIRPDGTYAGQAGGYGGPQHSEGPDADATEPGGGTYGYPHGPGLGGAGGRRPDDEATDLSSAPRVVPGDLDPHPGPGDRFGAGRPRWWRGAPEDAGEEPAEDTG